MQVTPVNILANSTSFTLSVLKVASRGNCPWVWPMRFLMDQKVESCLVAIFVNRRDGSVTGGAPLGIYGVTRKAVESFNACSRSTAISLPLAGLVSASTFFQTTKVSAIFTRVPPREKMYEAIQICRISMTQSYERWTTHGVPRGRRSVPLRSSK